MPIKSKGHRKKFPSDYSWVSSATMTGGAAIRPWEYIKTAPYPLCYKCTWNYSQGCWHLKFLNSLHTVNRHDNYGRTGYK